MPKEFSCITKNKNDGKNEYKKKPKEETHKTKKKNELHFYIRCLLCKTHC